MSRVGKKPIPIPDKTKVTYKDKTITVQGPKGSLTRTLQPFGRVGNQGWCHCRHSH